ncbi:sensor histidine kinase [Mastigocladopsis repens]|uniref:sensor histidine kinase n=1 Tax=Mastigocladopsis repens TaxID=221287 RepID=UPI0002F75F25
MKEAHYCYDRWGATAKVKDLEKRYPQLLNTNLVRQSHSIVTDETIRHPTAMIDLAAVMKAAQALSEIIHLDRLIATLMQVVIENAGAETGTLVLLEEDQLTVVAQCSGSRQCDLEKFALADCATIPVSVIHSVERTQETLVFDDAVSESSFSTDPYIQHRQTRSLLCMPILKQNQLIGILYLENNLSTGVFTSDRLQVLKLLIAQAAISLENARLYERLADYSEILERKVEERTQALQQEIAERQQTEAALRQSEANYRNLLQTANSVIIRYDPQGRIRYINDYGVKLLGYEEHEILGRTLFETIIPDIEISGRDVKPFVHDLLRNPQSYPQGEGENLCRDGRRVWVVWSNQAIFNEQGDVVEILSVGNDTTQRRQAEEALQRSEAKFRAIFENSQVGIYRTRLSDGLILNANQRYANLLGFDLPEEIIGLEHTIDYFVNPSDRQQAIELLKRDGEVRNFIKELARTGLIEARRSVVALRPQLLEEGSLQSALHRLVTQIRAAANDTILYYEIKGTAYALSTEVESNLLRIGQEALTNAIKHANADEIRVELVYDRDQFCLRVKDNGQGFGVGSILASEGFGLLGMSERAERIGAQLTIRSQPGQGTEIVVTVNP